MKEVDESQLELDALVDLFVKRTALKNTLSPSIAGAIRTGQQDLEIGVASNTDAAGLGRIKPGRAMANLDFRAGAFKIIGGETKAPIRQHMVNTIAVEMWQKELE